MKLKPHARRPNPNVISVSLLFLLSLVLAGCVLGQPPVAPEREVDPRSLPNSACSRVFLPIPPDPVDKYRADKGAAIEDHNLAGRLFCKSEAKWGAVGAPR
mgnify:CR=1 FL=1